MADFAVQYQRVWLVLSLYTIDLDYHLQVNRAWLDQYGWRVQRIEFNRAVLYLYEVDL